MDVGRRMDVDPSVEGPREGMQLEFQAGRDAEVRARAAQAPEQLRLLVDAGPHEAPVGGHELDRAEVVDRQSEPPLEPADTATEGQPGDTRVADDAHRADEPVFLGRDVELSEQCPAAAASEPSRRVDGDVVHPPEVDDEAAVGRGVPDRAVATTADRDLEVTLAAEADGSDDVLDVQGSDDQGRSPIEHRVPDPPGIVVAGGIGRHDLALERAAKFVELGARRHDGIRGRHALSLIRPARSRRLPGATRGSPTRHPRGSLARGPRGRRSFARRRGP